MILLAFLCLSLSYSSALPKFSDIPNDTPSPLFTRGDDARFDDRSPYSIFWSCVSTIFACTWIAIHPNIPGPKDSQVVVFCRRAALMGFALIAPEIMILWAGRQHRAAKQLTRQYKERGWTMAHSFFLIMGGFTLHDKEGTALRILEWKELDTLSGAGKIAWPSITEEEIQEKSKGDYLSKGIVLLQIGWFITQCVARLRYNIGFTELEIVTLGFTIYTAPTYYLWWHKPLDVRFSVPVHLLENENTNSQDEGIRSSSPTANPPSDSHSGTSAEPVEGLESTQADIAMDEGTDLLQIPPIVSELYFRVSIPLYHLENENIDSEGIRPGSPGPNLPSDPGPDVSSEPVEGQEPTQGRSLLISGDNELQQQPLIVSELDPDPGSQENPSNALGTKIRNALRGLGSFQFLEKLKHLFLQVRVGWTPTAAPRYEANFVLLRLYRTQLRRETGILMLPVVTLIRLFFAVVDAGSSNRLDQSKPLCVPTFYSPRVNDRGFSIHKSMAKNAFLVTAAVHLMLFILFAFVPRDGGISPEEIVWVGSVSLVALMSYIGALPFAPYIGGRVIVKLTRYRRLLEVLKLSVLMPAFIALYLTAKITILILSVIQLRALHQKTLVGIKWTSFFPHLG